MTEMLFNMRTLNDAIQLQSRLGLHFFDDKSLKYFCTTICTDVIDGKYFITHENYNDCNEYIVREINWKTGNITRPLEKTFKSQEETEAQIIVLAQNNSHDVKSHKIMSLNV